MDVEESLVLEFSLTDAPGLHEGHVGAEGGNQWDHPGVPGCVSEPAANVFL